MSETQKFKRELKDVVGVFLSKSHVKEPNPLDSSRLSAHISEPQVISFLAPFSEEKTFALNLLFSTCLSRFFKFCYFASNQLALEEINFAMRVLGKGKIKNSETEEMKMGKELASNCYWVQWQDKKFFDDVSISGSLGMTSQKDSLAGALVVLDLLRSNVVGFEHTLRVLDQIVLVIHPRIEDLKNAYKIIKTCHYINPQIEIAIIFDVQMAQNEVEEIFARFSGIVSEFLALPIRYLGAAQIDLNLKSFLEKIPTQLSLEALSMPRLNKTKSKSYSIEHIRFLQKLRMFIENDRNSDPLN